MPEWFMSLAKVYPEAVALTVLVTLVLATFRGWIAWKPEVDELKANIERLQEEVEDERRAREQERAACAAERREKDVVIYRLLSAARGASSVLRSGQREDQG